MKAAHEILVEVIEANAENISRESLTLPAGASVRDALTLCKISNVAQTLINMETVTHVADSMVGVWGRRVLLDAMLQSGDRIELYRAVTADAKSARLARAREQGYRWQGRTRRVAQSQK
jgi:uncharacterized protein